MPCNMQFWTSSIPGSSEVLPGAPATLYYTILCCPTHVMRNSCQCKDTAGRALRKRVVLHLGASLHL